MIEVRLQRSLVEKILCSSVGLFGCQKNEGFIPEVAAGRVEGQQVNQAEGIVPSTSMYVCY